MTLSNQIVFDFSYILNLKVFKFYAIPRCGTMEIWERQNMLPTNCPKITPKNAKLELHHDEFPSYETSVTIISNAFSLWCSSICLNVEHEKCIILSPCKLLNGFNHYSCIFHVLLTSCFIKCSCTHVCVY